MSLRDRDGDWMYGTWVEKWGRHRKSSAASNWYCEKNRHMVVVDSEAVVPKRYRRG